MKKELSEAVFQSRIVTLPGQILAYADFKPDSSLTILLIHEHLGLQNYIRVMGQALTNNNYSIVLPNLYEDTEDEEMEEDNAAYLQQLNQESMANKILAVIEYIAKKKGKIVVIGSSIGAAMALKILQYTNKVHSAFLFYGLPPVQTIRPSRITASVTIFAGTNDKVRHLSDPTVVRRAKTLLSKYPNFEVVQLEGAQHGFLNPASLSYDQKLFTMCCDKVQQYLELCVSGSQLPPPQHSSQRDNSTPNLQHRSGAQLPSQYQSGEPRQPSQGGPSQEVPEIAVEAFKKGKEKQQQEGGCSTM